MFTLTVPASFIGQSVNLCIQPTNPAAKPICHSIRIDTGATISVPVTTNVVAKVVKAKLSKKNKPKPRKQIAKASKAFSVSLQTGTTKHASGKAGKKVATTTHLAKTRKGAKK